MLNTCVLLSSFVNVFGIVSLSDIAYEYIPLASSVAVIFIVFVVTDRLFTIGFVVSIFVTSCEAAIP